MNSTTRKIKEVACSCSTLTEQLLALKNAYKGETCYLLTCGPSFGQFSQGFLRKRLKHELVIAVKQTYDIVGNISDFHLLNAWNYKPYNYGEPSPIILLERHPTHPEMPDVKYDLLFNCINVASDLPYKEKLKRRLCVSRRFQDYTFEKHIDRPWGPGIVYELGFYLAVHLGVSRIVVVGWDIGQPDSCYMPHFYKGGETQKLEVKPRHLVRNGKIEKILPGGSVQEVSISNSSEIVYNIPGYYENEVLEIALSTESVYQWLKNIGIALEIISNCSLASQSIPRVAF